MQVMLVNGDLAQIWKSTISSSFNETYAKIQALFAKKALTADPFLFSDREILLSNVGRDIGKARIIYLLQPHNNPKPIRIFNEAVIAAHYREGDTIQLECDSTKKPDAAALKDLAGLDPKKYNFRGWDAHGPCAKAEKEAKFWTRNERLDYVRKTWKERQGSQQKSIRKSLDYFGSNRVFVLTGPHHGTNNDPALRPIAVQFLPDMGYPFVIIDPAAFVSAHL